MKKLIFIVAFILPFLSCDTNKRVSIVQYSTPLPADATVDVLGMGQKVPAEAKLLGNIKIGDTGFTTKCGYSDVITEAQKQARAMGGNIVHITWHKEPNVLTSTCHRIKADIYKK